ncbi:hypothetical protein Acr_06g0008320 [Actinidia rufa]|uniref:Uncharacterized protein n=1 Tax=Actinidia rufa TaxID=165716 RepID=A0A7J0ERC7_9ERIC|nr:hypothetical protein Acr_06g0008320 [Actinidia rufa]
MRQMKLLFSAEDLLHVYIMLLPKREPGTPFLKGNHYLCLRNPCQPQTRLVTNNPNKDLFLNELNWVPGNWEFQARKMILTTNSDANPRSHVIPYKAKVLDKIRLPPMCIEGWAPRCDNFSVESYNAELNANLPPTQIQGWEKGVTSSSSSYTSYESSNNEEEEGEEVVTMANFTKDYNTGLVLSQVVLLLKDITDLVEEDSKEIRDMLVMQQVRRATAILEQMNEQSTEIKKSREKINPLEKYNSPCSRVSGPPQVYSPLVLSSLNEEDMLEEEADEVPKKAPEVLKELGQEATEDGTTVAVGGTTPVVEDGTAA